MQPPIFAELLYWTRLPPFERFTVSSTCQLTCEVSTLTEHEGTVGVVKAGLASECVQQEAVDVLGCLTSTRRTCSTLCINMLQRMPHLIDIAVAALIPRGCFAGVAGLAVDLYTMTRHESDLMGGTDKNGTRLLDSSRHIASVSVYTRWVPAG